MTHDLEGDLRDALLPLRDWETADAGAPDDLVAAILAVFAPLEAERDQLKAERDGYRAQLAADWQARQITDLMKAAGRAHEERDQARAEVKRLTEMNAAATRLHAHALGTNDDLRDQIAQVQEYVGGELTLTNAEMADLAELDHDTYHEECSQVWQRYYLRMVRAALDGSPS